jgi:dihydroorotate dehydrogenase (NAD+) catalytic subunit
VTVDLGGLILDNPVMMASGTFGLGDRWPEHYAAAGAFVSKTVTRAPRVGNPPCRIVETPSGLVNSVGLQNPGIEAYVELVASLRPPTVFVSSVYAADPDDLCEMIERLEALDVVAGYELNFSCPNVKQRRVMPSLDEQLVDSLMRAARGCSDRWMCAKLPPYTCIDLGPLCEAGGANALCVSNTYPGIAFDPHGARLQGGLCGPAVKPMTAYNVHHTAARVEIPIIASGGVTTGSDVRDLLSVGARAVQLGSVNFVDPGAAARVLREWRALEDTTADSKGAPL